MNAADDHGSELLDSDDKPKRWGKERDKLMFFLLTGLSNQYGVPISELAYPLSISDSTHYKMLLNLKREMQWVGTTRQILKRICLLKSNSKLSVRDKRKLRKLIRDQIDEDCLDFNKILYEFPCKDVAEIKRMYLQFQLK